MSGDIFREFSDTLINEDGGGYGFVMISGVKWVGTVGEFLSNPVNQVVGKEWAIDGGWGGPPGPIVVRWNGEFFENGGFCGHEFK